MYELKIITEFSAAHNLRNFRGKCEALHGHNWKVEVVLSGKNLDEKKVARAVTMTAEKYCSVSIMLSATVEITHDFEIIEL